MLRHYEIAAAAGVALLGPLIVNSAYLSLSRSPDRWFTAATDWAAMGAAILVGLTGLLSLPWTRWQKAAATLFYIPAMGALLTITAILFVCGMFGDCL